MKPFFRNLRICHPPIESHQPSWAKTSLNCKIGPTQQISDVNIWSSLPISVEPSRDLLDGSNDLFKISSENSADEKSSINPQVVIVFTPGNPGLIEFYQFFLTRLFNELQSKSISTVIVESSHLSHRVQCSESLSQTLGQFLASLKVLASNLKINWWSRIFNRNRHLEDSSLTLSHQVDYHDKLFKKVYSSFNVSQDHHKPKFILIGHSVGAYIASKVIERNEDQVDHLIGLFPTISEIGQSRNAAKISPLLASFNLPLINLLQVIISITVPKSILARLVKGRSGYFTIKSQNPNLKAEETEDFNSKLIVQLVVNPHLVSSILQMAAAEMKAIKTLDSDFLKKFRSKLTFFYTSPDQDHWIDEKEILKIGDIFGVQSFSSDSRDLTHGSFTRLDHPSNSQLIHRKDHIQSERLTSFNAKRPFGSNIIRSTEEIPHAFCLDHSDPVALRCTEWIQCILEK